MFLSAFAEDHGFTRGAQYVGLNDLALLEKAAVLLIVSYSRTANALLGRAGMNAPGGLETASPQINQGFFRLS